jgi:hypothetical protein
MVMRVQGEERMREGGTQVIWVAKRSGVMDGEKEVSWVAKKEWCDGWREGRRCGYTRTRERPA